MSENGFNCYFPDRIMAELDDLASVKFLHHLFKKCRMAKSTESVSILREEIQGISRQSFYNAIKKLESEKWIFVEKPNCHEYLVTLIDNYHFTKSELDHLKGQHKNQISKRVN